MARLLPLLLCLACSPCSPGAAVLPHAANSVIEARPIKESYDPEEYIRFSAKPASAAYRFLYWENNSNFVSEPTLDIPAKWASGYTAVSGRIYARPGVTLTVPDHSILADEVSFGEGGVGLELSPLPTNSAKRVRLAATGPGAIKFDAYSIGGSYAALGTMSFTGGLKETALWVPPGGIDLELPLVNSLHIRNLRFEAGYAVAVEVVGDGEALGLPEGGIAQLGDVLALSATPADGWEFAGWSGDVDSDAESIELEVASDTLLEAKFYQSFTLAGVPGRQLGKNLWSVHQEDESLTAPSGGYWDKSVVEWQLEGPGAFSFDYNPGYQSFSVALDGKILGSLPLPAEGQDFATVYIDVPAGTHRISATATALSSYPGAESLILKSTAWEPGYPVSILATVGGAIEGAPPPGSRVAPGTVLELEVFPEAGATFEHWTDPLRTAHPNLSVEVWGPVEIEPIFSAPTHEDGWPTHAQGSAFWTKSADDKWVSPANLLRGQRARLSGPLSNATRITMRKEDLNNGSSATIRYGFDGQVAETLSSDYSRIDVPAGAHEFFLEIEAHFDTSPAQVAISEFSRWVPVEIRNRQAAQLTLTPKLVDEYGSATGLNGFAKLGTELAFELQLRPGQTLAGWKGELAGQGATGTIHVSEPISAEPVIETRQWTAGARQWTVSPPVGAHPSGSNLYLSGESPTVELTSEITGPAVLSFFSYGTSLLATVDGQPATEIPMHPYDYTLSIPEGIHSVELVVEAGSERYDPFSEGIGSPIVRPGYAFVMWQAVGGEVETNLTSAIVAKGFPAVVKAKPSPNNDFLGWAGSLSGKPANHSFAVSESGHAYPIFGARANAGGYQWTFAGARPSYAEGAEPGARDWLSYTLEPSSVPFAATATTTVEGPGLLMAFAQPHHDSAISIALEVDGEPFEARDWDRIWLAPGLHDVKWKISAPSGISERAFVQLTAPTVDRLLLLETYAASATVERSPDKPRYDYGDTVTFTAPATDDNGDAFQGWWQASGEATGDEVVFSLVSLDKALSRTLTQSLSYYARYAPAGLDLPGAAVVPSDANHWEMVAGGGLNGRDAWTTQTNSRLSIGVVQDSVISFQAKVEADNSGFPLLRISRAGEALVETVVPHDWRRYAVFIEAGETLSIETITHAGSFYLGDVEASAGWGPTFVIWGDGAIASTADGDLRILAPSSNASSFAGWLNADGAIDSTPTLSVPVGHRDLVQPVFKGTFETPIGPAEVDFTDAWSLSSGDVRSDTRVTGADQHEIRFQLTGPSVVEVAAHATLRAHLDGSDAAWIELFATSKALQIPEGVHELTIIHDGGFAGSFANIHLSTRENSYVFGAREFPGGTVSPLTSSVDGGELMHFRAQPSPGYEFAGWQSPFENYGPYVSQLAEDAIFPTPIFKPASLEFVALDATWTAHGVTVEREVYVPQTGPSHRIQNTVTIRAHSNDSRAWAQTTIPGPAIWEAPPRRAHVEFGPRGAPDFDIVSEVGANGTLRLGIPSGATPVRLTPISAAYEIDLGGESRIRPGCLVVARGVGLTTRLEPHMAVYPVGASVTVTVVESISPDRIDWRGLPTSATISGRSASFVVSDHVRVEALRWEAITLGDLEGRAAGSRRWTRDADGAWQLPGLEVGEGAYLAITTQDAGTLGFELSAAPSSNARFPLLEARARGRTIVRQLRGPKLEAYARIGAGDELALRFLGALAPAQADGHDYPIKLGNLDFVADAHSAYLSWWTKYDRSGLAAQSALEPSADSDRDGFPNYLEYLLDSNPLSPDLVVEIALREARFVLANRSLPDNAPGSLHFEYSLSPLGPWVNAQDFLEDGEAPVGNGWTTRWLQEMPEPNTPAFFRLKYSGEIPSLSEMLGD